MADATAAPPVLSVRELVTEIRGRAVVDHVSLDVRPGEVVALVGESGSGKSLTALTVMGLLPGAATATSGTVLLDGDDLLQKSDSEMRAVRGRRLSMIFQEPVASLNPLMPVGAQVAESLSCTARPPATTPTSARWRCCAMSASRSRSAAPRSCRWSFPAACASA